MNIASQFEKNIPLYRFSTFRIGGPARLFVAIASIDDMIDVIHYSIKNQIPFLIIGKGSNCLFSDKEFDGLVIQNKIQFFTNDKGKINVGSGYSFSSLGAKVSKEGWGGLEFAAGIPGTIGGAIYMNAGANSAKTSDVLTHVTYVDKKGQLIERKKEELEFRYRFSSFHKMQAIIVAAKFYLKPSKDAKQKQAEIVSYRTHSQPYGKQSAGCIFRNPPSTSAGALIEECGLKGMSIGGAEVSLKHANFIINKGSATAQDVLNLISLIQETVRKKRGIDLKLEVQYIDGISSRSSLP